MVNPANVANVAKEIIDSAYKAMDLYDRIIDKLIPWKEFKEAIEAIISAKEIYSNDTAKIAGEVKALFMDSEDQYNSATREIYEWCSLSSTFLKAYKPLLDKQDETNFNAGKTILMQLLSTGVTKMTESIAKLGKASSTFNAASGKLLEMSVKLDNDLNTEIDKAELKISEIRNNSLYLMAFGLIVSIISTSVVEGKLVPDIRQEIVGLTDFFKVLSKKINDASTLIDDTKSKLKSEIDNMTELKIKTEETHTFVELGYLFIQAIKNSVEGLIKLCDEYQKRHGKK